MKTETYFVIALVLLYAGYLAQNYTIYRMRQNIDKQIELTEKQIVSTLMLLDAMAKNAQKGGGK